MKSKLTGTKIIKFIIEAAPLAMIAVCAILYFTIFRHITTEHILEYTPENIFLAALVIIGMFALKSVTFFFPMLVLMTACGTISPNIFIALIINAAGTFCMINIPYFIGRFAERDFVQRIIGKYKKMKQVQDINMSNEMYFAFFLRVISCLPFDIVSMFLGASGMKWRNYAIGSMIGTLPGMICSTILGYYIDDLLSPICITALAIEVASAVFFGVKYILYIRRKKRETQ